MRGLFRHNSQKPGAHRCRSARARSIPRSIEPHGREVAPRARGRKQLRVRHQGVERPRHRASCHVIVVERERRQRHHEPRAEGGECRPIATSGQREDDDAPERSTERIARCSQGRKAASSPCPAAASPRLSARHHGVANEQRDDQARRNFRIVALVGERRDRQARETVSRR